MGVRGRNLLSHLGGDRRVGDTMIENPIIVRGLRRTMLRGSRRGSRKGNRIELQCLKQKERPENIQGYDEEK